MTDRTPCLYLDFSREADQLRRQLHDLKRLHRDQLFPSLTDDAEPLPHLVANVFPDGLRQTAYLTNTSLRPGHTDVTLRPRVDGPRLLQEFPRGLALCVRALPTLHPSPFLIVDRVQVVADAQRRDFEVEADFVAHTNAEVFRVAARPDNLLRGDLLARLPRISEATHTNLADWRGYLQWKRRLVLAGLAGVRYLRRDLRDGLLVFLAAFEDESAFERFRRTLRGEELGAFAAAHSTDAWNFRLNEQGRERPADLGDFRQAAPQDAVAAPEGCPWPSLLPVELGFALTAPDQAPFEEHYGDDPDAVRERILGRYPADGFLAVSAAGDLALVRRQERALDDLEQQSGYAPFLSSWLFDVASATPAPATPTVEE